LGFQHFWPLFNVAVYRTLPLESKYCKPAVDILIEPPPQTVAWAAVMDRLNRATAEDPEEAKKPKRGKAKAEDADDEADSLPELVPDFPWPRSKTTVRGGKAQSKGEPAVADFPWPRSAMIETDVSKPDIADFPWPSSAMLESQPVKTGPADFPWPRASMLERRVGQ